LIYPKLHTPNNRLPGLLANPNHGQKRQQALAQADASARQRRVAFRSQLRQLAGLSHQRGLDGLDGLRHLRNGQDALGLLLGKIFAQDF